MSKQSFADGKVGPAWDSIETKAHARYLLERRIPGTDLVLTDYAMCVRCRAPMSSDQLRAAADAALLAELEASIDPVVGDDDIPECMR